LEFLGKRTAFVSLRHIASFVEQNAHPLVPDVAAPEDDTVTGLCSHVYHRECIMNWFHDGHDECPNCRQPMWDPETYKMVDQSIQDHGSSSARYMEEI
jgi:hypothetical protein